MSVFVIILYIFIYFVIGGMVMTIAEKAGVMECELEFIPPIVVVILWPIFVVIGVILWPIFVVIGLILLIIFGSASLGGWLMEQFLKKVEVKEDKKEQ